MQKKQKTKREFFPLILLNHTGSCSSNPPDARELLITRQYFLSNGGVKRRGREFGLEVILQCLHDVLHEHAHNLTKLSLCMVLWK